MFDLLFASCIGKIKYNKKFCLVFPNGKLNRVGPGYEKDSGDLVITNHVVYNPNVDRVILREKIKHNRQEREASQAFLDFFFGKY